MKLIVAGSRAYNDYQLLKSSILEEFSDSLHELEIVSGTARGADQLGERFALEHNLKVHKYPADWNKYGKSAGYRRNEIMAQNADILMAFWDGQSKGTKHMIDLASKHNLLVIVVKF